MPRDFFHRQRRVLFIGQTESFGADLLDRMSDHEQLSFEIAKTAMAGLAVALAQAKQFDAILIAVDLPDGDGPATCSRLRDAGIHIPVLLLAEQDSEFEVIRGLDAGANDFISMPIRHAELVARLRAQIRAYETSEEAVLAIGPFEFRPASRLLQNTLTHTRVRLTEKEASVLKYLYRADGPVPRNTLLHEVWGYNARATTHTVETHIYRLRRKIEPDPSRIALLVNEDGGYRLCIDTPTMTPAWMPRACAMAQAAE